MDTAHKVANNDDIDVFKLLDNGKTFSKTSSKAVFKSTHAKNFSKANQSLDLAIGLFKTLRMDFLISIASLIDIDQYGAIDLKKKEVSTEVTDLVKNRIATMMVLQAAYGDLKTGAVRSTIVSATKAAIVDMKVTLHDTILQLMESESHQ